MTPYLCHYCETAGARFRRYKSVRGFFIFSTISETKAVAVCDHHAFRASLPTTGLNLLFGWWGIHAFFWNLYALIKNSRGGRDVTNEIESIYAATAQEAKNLIEKSTSSITTPKI